MFWLNSLIDKVELCRVVMSALSQAIVKVEICECDLGLRRLSFSFPCYRLYHVSL
jgi:hypothetical protein